MIELYNDDCLNILKTIPSNSVDLILTDPPYEISRESGFNGGKLKKFTVYKTDFGSWDHEKVKLDEVIRESYRILKDNGTFLCFYDLWKITLLKELLENAKFKQLRFIEWVKTNPVPVNSKLNYLTNAREIAISCTKKGKPTFNSKYDNGIYSYPICHGKDRVHPTQKPVKLFEELVLKHSNEGNTVLDMFMGSGTTGVACKNLNRNFIGIELNPKYFEIAKTRIE